jgi:predicted nucleic acid-binding protein
MIPTVFVDANILFAACASRTGASFAVLSFAEIGMLQLVLSRQILDEAERNLQHKFPDGLPILTEWLANIGPTVLKDPVLDEYERWLPIIEAKDAPILEAAVQFAPNYLLTLNSKDFTPEVARATGLTIQSPGEFVQSIRHLFVHNL